MQLIFLGTSCMVPTKDRNHPTVLLSYKSEDILVDCGEGTQRQIKIAGLSASRIKKILITHWHGDHVLGLPGLIQTLAASEYDGELSIYGPPGTKERIGNMFHAFVFDKKIELKVHEIKKPGRFFDCDAYSLFAHQLEHGIETLGYAFIEKDRKRINVQYVRKKGIVDGPLLGKLQKGQSITWKGEKIKPEKATYIVNGKKVGFVSDTVLCNACSSIAKDSDVLVCESAYASALEEKARQYNHMTSKQAASLAAENGVKKLILTHFSQRYKDTSELEEEAKVIFPNTICAHDFLKIKV